MRINSIDRGERVRHRYLVRDGRVHGLSVAPHGLFTSGYLSPLARLRLLLEPFAPTVEADESIADFVRRRFGREFLDYLIDPLVGGLYAGDPERLSMAAVLPQLKGLERRYGSVLRGVVQARLRRGHANPAHPANRMLFSFCQGLGALQPIPGGGFLLHPRQRAATHPRRRFPAASQEG
jgi:oxygen-dependent protoporphyrinogen oxidase